MLPTRSPSRPRSFDPRTTAEVDSSRNMTNRKPYRTALQKQDARDAAKKVDGAWVSSAPVSHHKGSK
jgi:hypothetical protein